MLKPSGHLIALTGEVRQGSTTAMRPLPQLLRFHRGKVRPTWKSSSEVSKRRGYEEAYNENQNPYFFRAYYGPDSGLCTLVLIPFFSWPTYFQILCRCGNLSLREVKLFSCSHTCNNWRSCGSNPRVIPTSTVWIILLGVERKGRNGIGKEGVAEEGGRDTM